MRLTAATLVVIVALSSTSLGQESKLPPAAQAKFRDAVQSAELARESYYREVARIRDKLLQDLESQLQTAGRTGDREGALAIRKEIDRLKEDDFLTAIEGVLGKSRLLAAVEKSLVGTWQVKLSRREKSLFVSDWTFEPGGAVTSTNPMGAPRGNWKIELERTRVYIVWSPEAWESFQLPLDPEMSLGTSWSGKDVVLTATKKAK